MIQRFKIAPFILLAAAATWTLPAANADQSDKLTIVTFNEAVEIPGQVLPAGTYVFKLLDSQTERCVVQIFNRDQNHLIATIMAVPDYRLDPTGDTAVSFEERPWGSPEALHSWFYPGDNYGLQFVYPKSEQRFGASSEPALPELQMAVAAPPPEPEQVPVPAIATTNSSDPVVVPEETITFVEAAPGTLVDGVPTASALPETLPQTAGNFAVIPLFGVLLLSGGFTTIRFAARQN